MNTQNKSLWFLIIAQTLFMIMNMMYVTLAPLMGKQLASNINLSTLPLAISMLTMLIVSFPLSIWMGKIGRAFVFKTGILASMVAGVVFATALLLHQFWMLLVGGIFFGYSVACANFYRFAAMEMVTPNQHASAMAKIMAVGVVAGLLGPNLAKYSKDFMFDVSFVSSVLSFMPLAMVALVFMLLIKWPEIVKKANADQAQSEQSTPNKTEVKQRNKTSIIVYKPILTAMVAYGVMVLIMSATPLHMDHHHYHFDDTAWVIQWHILGMFAPSFFIGYLVKRIGKIQLLILGVLVMSLSIIINLYADSKLLLTMGLLLLGVGWNFLFIGSSQWLMSFLNDDNRSKIQGINEVLVFGLSSVAVLSSAWLINTLGWKVLNLASLPLLGILLVVLLHSLITNEEKKAEAL